MSLKDTTDIALIKLHAEVHALNRKCDNCKVDEHNQIVKELEERDILHIERDELDKVDIKSIKKKVTDQDIYDSAPNVVIVDGQPWIGYLTDNTLSFKLKPDSRIIKAIKSSKPEWWSNLIHTNFDTEGTGAKPMYRLAFAKISKKEFTKELRIY